MSVQQMFALVLAALLVCPTEIRAQQKPVPHEQSLKAQIIEIPAGSVVSVKLVNKQKLRGKLGLVTDSGFELQSLKDGKVSSQNLQYEDVKSVKHQEKGMSTATKITLGALAGFGVLALVGVAIAAGHGG